jgi:adenylate kinase
VNILIFFGPPGSGKGTQAKKLAQEHKLPHIALGDILREEVRAGSKIGEQAKALMNAGKLVPDELTIELTSQRIGRPDCLAGFILDGFPRSLAQAEALDKMLADHKWEIAKVVYFDIEEDVVVGRLSGRRSCKSCGAVYHTKFNPSKQSGKCDLCGGELYQRKDDEEGVIRQRFEVYREQTQPLIERYIRSEKLVKLDASRPIDEVYRELTRVLAPANVH